MQPVFHIQLLGGFQLVYNDKPVIVDSVRLQSLLAYLFIHHPTPQPRRQIAFLLWPDNTESQAYRNLRRQLHHLRNDLSIIDQFLEIDNVFVRWRADALLSLDVAHFRRLLAEAGAVSHTHPARMGHLLQQAVDSYRGPLLPNCYDEWIIPFREELEALFGHALEQLAAALEAQRDYAAAIRTAERLLHHEPLAESIYRRLMRLHSLNKDRARALRIYHDCSAILAQELGVEPALDTQMLYRQLHQVEEATSEQAGKDIALAAIPPLVGRQDAWQELLAVYHRADSGDAHMVLISGEAGIGKSRLAEELLIWTKRQGILTARTRAYMAQGSLAYGPIVELLRTDSLQTRWSKLADVWLGELMWLLPELQEIHPHLPLAPAPCEHWRRRRLMEALARALLADDEPRVLLIDDLQWCDEETLELLQYLLNFAPRARLLLVGTARAEEIANEHPLTALRHNLNRDEQLTEIEIGPLTPEETTALGAQVGAGQLNTELTAQLYDQTEGNPLFVVETVRADLLTTGFAAAAKSARDLAGQSTQALPPKISAVIQSRLAQLSPVAQTLTSFAAAIGRSFTLGLLVAATGEDEDAIIYSLDELWQRRIIRTQGINAYDFSHDRIRDVAYVGISPILLPQMHRRIAEALETVYADELDAVASQLAAHYEQAGLVSNAIVWHRRAAEILQRLHAANDAVRHLSSALTLLAKLPDSPKRIQEEISLQLTLSDTLMAAKGLAARERLQALSRARDLLQSAGDVARDPSHRWQLFLILQGMNGYHIAHMGVHVARQLTAKLVEIGQELGDPLLQTIATRSEGGVHFALGEFTAAHEKHQQAFDLLRRIASTDRRAPFLEDNSAPDFYLRSLAMALAMRGYVDQARARMAEAFVHTEARAATFPTMASLFLASLLYRILEDVDQVQAFGERMLAHGVQYELPLSICGGTYCRGWVLARKGDLAGAIPLLEKATNGFRQAEHTMYQTYRLGALADLYIQVNRLEDAEATLQEARFISENGHERFWDAEIHRMYGNLAQARGEADVAVERHYIQAFELARTQQSKTLELRAAISLAHLWRKQGAHAKAYTMLSETVNWFTEGFDTFHFKAATALLDELSGARQSQPDHPPDIHSVGSTNGHWRSQTGSDE